MAKDSDGNVINPETTSTSTLDLRAYGYAPGSYMGRCHGCDETHWNLDKRATRCERCAMIGCIKRLSSTLTDPDQLVKSLISKDPETIHKSAITLAENIGMVLINGHDEYADELGEDHAVIHIRALAHMHGYDLKRVNESGSVPPDKLNRGPSEDSYT